VQVQQAGTVHLHNAKTVIRENGDLVTVSRSSVLAIADEQGREREKYKLPYGAVLSAKDGASVESGAVIAKWDPHTHPIIAETAGQVVFVGMEDGITVNSKIDELTGVSNVAVIAAKDRSGTGKDIRPMIKLLDE